MNPKELIRTSLSHESFTVSRHRLPRFLNVWHYHQELELVYIKKSTGTIFIGDCIEQFSAGDLVFIGSCLPHLWLNDKAYFERKDLTAEAMVIHFHPHCFGDKFFTIPEMHKIHKVIEEAKTGIRLEGTNKRKITSMIEGLFFENELNKVISLLQILRLIADESGKVFLSSHSFINAYAKNSNTKLDKVYEYILNNFKEEINLNRTADLVHMNPSAFSRYFKQTTNKTFVQFLNEVRIGYACKLLMDQGDKNISEIAFECGYRNLSNFNRQFKLITRKTPKDYLTSHHQAFTTPVSLNG